MLPERNRWWLLGALVVWLAPAQLTANQDGEEAPSPMTAAEVTHHFASSVVLLRTEMPGEQTQTGSGFFIGPAGAVATSLHVLDGARSVFVRIDGERFEVSSVRAFDIERDLALLQLEGIDSQVLVPGDTSTLQRGDVIYVISNPLGLEGTVSEGLLGAWREPRVELADDPAALSMLAGVPRGRLLQISAAISPGSSGAPVFDDYGYVVGMVAGGLGAGALDLNFAVPIEALLPLLERDEGWDLISLNDTIDRLRADLAEPHLVDARFSLETEDLAGASRALDRALGVFPRSGEALRLKGQVLLQAGRLGEAEAMFRRAVDANPDAADTWQDLGGFLLQHGTSDQAMEAAVALERALELDPWRADAAYGLGLSHAKGGRLDEARERLEQAVDSDREHVPAWLALGELCLLLDDLDAATEAFESAVWVDRENTHANCRLAAIYDSNGDDRAAKHRRRCEDSQ